MDSNRSRTLALLFLLRIYLGQASEASPRLLSPSPVTRAHPSDGLSFFFFRESQRCSDDDDDDDDDDDSDDDDDDDARDGTRRR